MCVACLIPDAKLHDPAQAESAVLRDGNARPSSLPGNHRQAIAAEQLVHRIVAEVGGAGADGERRRHQHPAGRRIAVRYRFDDAKGRHRVELGAAANRSRDPHPEQPFAREGFDNRRRQRALPVTLLGVFIRYRRGAAGAAKQIRRSFDACGAHRAPLFPFPLRKSYLMADGDYYVRLS